MSWDLRMALNKKKQWEGTCHHGCHSWYICEALMAENTWKQRSNFKRDMILVETHHVRYISLGSSSDVNKLNQVCTSVWYWKTICTYMYVQMDIKYIHAYINQQLGFSRLLPHVWKNSPNSSRLIQRVFLCHFPNLLIWSSEPTAWRNMAKHGHWMKIVPPQKKIPWLAGQSTIVKDAFPIEKWGIFQMSS